MAKTVKLDDKVHRELEELRLKKETFSDVVARLISFYHAITMAAWSHTGEHPHTPDQGG